MPFLVSDEFYAAVCVFFLIFFPAPFTSYLSFTSLTLSPPHSPMQDTSPLLSIELVAKRQEDLQLFRDLLSVSEVIGDGGQEDNQ